MNNVRKSDALILAYKALAYEYNEKGKRAGELVIANKELALQNEEKEKRAFELVIAQKELHFQNGEKGKRASEFIIAYNELKKREMYLKEHLKELHEMLFITSHKVRKPIANILGLSELLNRTIRSKKLRQTVDYLVQSALSLDTFTRELTAFMNGLEQKWKKENLGCKHLTEPPE